jgi:hypothetical protein
MAVRTICGAAAMALALALAACGSTSKLQRDETVQRNDFTQYRTIVVGEFRNNPARPVRESIRAEYDAEARAAGQRFAQMLSNELVAYGVRGEVVREMRPGALLIDGDITRYRDGNAALRALIGFGAGSSYFDATVRFTDADSGRVLGTIMVDKNSWPLGGLAAAFQDGDAHMQGAAARIAEEVAISQGVISKRGQPAKSRRKTQTGCGRGGPGCSDG